MCHYYDTFKIQWDPVASGKSCVDTFIDVVNTLSNELCVRRTCHVATRGSLLTWLILMALFGRVGPLTGKDNF